MKKKSKNLSPENIPIGSDSLEEGRLELILDRELKEWKVVKSKLPENPILSRTELYREYRFKNFNSVMEYMNKVAIECNRISHHPRWENSWSTLKVWLTTWDVEHTISLKDIKLAMLMDETFIEYESVK
jgi:pterin-4a-carbinolamine dehydratase